MDNDNSINEENNTSTQENEHSSNTAEQQLPEGTQQSFHDKEISSVSDPVHTSDTEETVSSDSVEVQETSSDDQSASEGANKYVKSASNVQQSSYRREGGGYGGYRSNRSFDRRNEFSKDRDFRFKKFRKYDKIATRKLDIDYKKPHILKEFLTEKGKILSASFTGNSSKNQRRLIREVKRARYIGLLPSA